MTEPTQEQVERAKLLLDEAMPGAFWHDVPVSNRVLLAFAGVLAAHDADREAFSEVAKLLCCGQVGHTSDYIRMHLASFILPDPEPADLVREKLLSGFSPEWVDETMDFLAKHNLEIRSIDNGQA